MPQSVNRLLAARMAAGWSQSHLIAAMRSAATPSKVSLPSDESLRTNLKRWESGKVIPGAEYRRLFQYIYGMTADQLGFPPFDDRTAHFLAVPSGHLSGEALSYYGVLLDSHIRADNLLGPGDVLTIVREQVNTLHIAARQARGGQRSPILQMACRYYEFYGWLLQDSGRCDDARVSTDRARDLAIEIDDASVTAYLMMRRSNIATDDGDPALAVSLADAALTAYGPRITPRIRSLLSRQKANAHAGLGEAEECASAIGEAVDLSEQLPTTGGPEFAEYCTPGYVAMEAGTCWLDLGDPHRALAAFSRSPIEWNPVFRRDQGLSLARRAAVHAGVGDFVTACIAARQAVEIVSITRSARTLKELRRARDQLRPGSDDSQVAAVRQAIGGVLATA